jgi:hypothetical protein
MVAPKFDTLSFVGALRSMAGDGLGCLSMQSDSAKPGSPTTLKRCWNDPVPGEAGGKGRAPSTASAFWRGAQV